MRLKDFSITDGKWQLQGIRGLGPQNLIVGMNAVGKTRTINSIARVANMIKQNDLSNERNVLVEMTLIDDTSEYAYKFEIDNGAVKSEYLKVDNENVIERNGDLCKIKGEEITPPSNKLVVNSRRDSKDYPYNDKIVEWAEDAVMIKFSSIEKLPSDIRSIENNLLVQMYKELSNDERAMIVSQLQELGYEITSIRTHDMGYFHFLIVKEKNVESNLFTHNLSTGLLRTLFVLVFIAINTRRQSGMLIMIDDFCEGLDYKRATMLGKMVFEKTKGKNGQLIVSSNDSFLMDVVDLKQWNILKRDGDVVRCYNYASNAEMFKSFMLTGLSNFDFFASDFINAYERK